MKVAPYVRKVNFHETDAMGVVHHTNYLKYFEEARVDWLQKVGHPYEVTAAKGIHYAMVNVSCSYLRAAQFGDEVSVTIGLRELTSARMVIWFEIRVGDEVSARGDGSFCAVSVAGGSPRIVSLRREVPEFFELLDGLERG